jgi:hypothetical protein
MSPGSELKKIAGEVSGQLHIPAILPPGKVPHRYSFDRRLGEPLIWSGRHGENSLPYWDKNSDPLII